MNLIKKVTIIFLTVFLLSACESSIEETSFPITDISLTPSTPSKTPFTTLTRAPTLTKTPTLVPVPTSTMTLTPTLNPTQQTWISTYIANRATQQILNHQEKEIKEIEIAKFPIVCDGKPHGSLSPNGKWLATSCEYKIDQTLIVQNKEGKKWVLKFNDFLHPNLANRGMPGLINVMSWGTEGRYLYFTNSLGWSGGGDFCFPGYGTNGLFRLNLNTGSWVTLISPPEYFPGDEIKFSPTGRRYAVDLNGITINDLNTGEAIQINAEGVIEFVWSSDGTNLAYSVASCNEEGFVTSSSLYIWDAIKNESRLITTTEKILLTPLSWDESSPLKIESEEYIQEPRNTIYTLYEYDIETDKLIFIGPISLLPH